MHTYSDSPQKRIRQIREEANLDIINFANQLNVSVDQLVQWENGINFPTYSFIEQIEINYHKLLLEKPEEIEIYRKLISSIPLTKSEFLKSLRLLDEIDLVQRLDCYEITQFTPKELTALLPYYREDKIDQWLDYHLPLPLKSIVSTFPFLNET